MATLASLFKNPSDVDLEFADRYTRLPASGQRDRNFEAYAASGLPTRRVEAWKWSDLRGVLSKIPSDFDGGLPNNPFNELDDVTVFRFGKDGLVAPSNLPEGITVMKQASGSALAGAEETPVAALGAALSDKPGVLFLDVSKTVATPLHFVFETETSLAFSHISMVFREGVELNVLESHIASGGFSNRVLEYDLKPGAKLNRTIFQAANPSAVQVITGLIQLEQGAHFNQSALGFGARLCRNETRVFHQAADAEANINSAYLIGAGYHYDQTSLVRHSQEGCATNQLCKGAVMDEGQAVFQGKFYVARRAQQTDAQMAHHALILEDGGTVNAKPELEIYADDVQCAHGNTVGSLDQDAIFYMRQRGLTDRAARALLTEAFILETFDAAPEAFCEILSDQARHWLNGQV